jgi:antirestriction protein ArdC
VLLWPQICNLRRHFATIMSGYIASWLEVLKRDKHAIFSAAARAHRAVEFLEALQQSPTEAAS